VAQAGKPVPDAALWPSAPIIRPPAAQ